MNNISEFLIVINNFLINRFTNMMNISKFIKTIKYNNEKINIFDNIEIAKQIFLDKNNHLLKSIHY